MMLEALTLSHWRQFADVEIAFHPRLTVLTGANGAGKTTILHLINRHWGWNIPFASTPRLTRRGLKKYLAGFWSDRSDYSEAVQEPEVTIGRIEYRDHPTAAVSVPSSVPETFTPQIRPTASLPGVYVSSHRPLYIHQPVPEIPTRVDAREQLFNNYLNEIRGAWAINRRVQSPTHMLKRSLISLALFGYGNEAAIPNLEARETFEGFQEVLAITLPRSLGFQQLRIRSPDVVLETTSGDFSLDAVSGGVSAIIDVVWQVYLYSLLHEEFVVVIDEPEAHLHPQLQKEILPNLLQAFTSAQFIVATHNPFVVTSVPDSNVYVLRYNEHRRVDSVLLEDMNKAGTSNEILREVLGVDSAAPRWVDERFEEIVSRYMSMSLSRDTLSEFRQELETLGLGRYVPQAIDRVLEEGGPDAKA